MAMGISFVPGQGEIGNQNAPGQPGGANPIQTAIQMLSLRLPRVAGANAMAPGALLNSPGGMGMGGGSAMDNPILQALLRLAGMSGGGPGMGPMGGPMAPGGMTAPPPPRFKPGEGGQVQLDDRRNVPPIGDRTGGQPTSGINPVGPGQNFGVPSLPGMPGEMPFFNRAPRGGPLTPGF